MSERLAVGKIVFSVPNDPASWHAPDTLAFKMASNEDAKKAEKILNDLLAERDDLREQLERARAALRELPEPTEETDWQCWKQWTLDHARALHEAKGE